MLAKIANSYLYVLELWKNVRTVSGNVFVKHHPLKNRFFKQKSQAQTRKPIQKQGQNE